MPVGAGLAGQLIAKKETTYGTRVVPDKAFELNSEGVKLTRNRIYSKGIRAGRLFQRDSRVASPTRQAEGPVSLEVVNKGMGFWFDLATGETVTPVQQGVTAAYLSTFNIGTSTPPNKSATIQVGKPGTAEAVNPYDYLGSVLNELTLTQETGEFLMMETGLDVRDRQTSQALEVASYPTGLETFHFGQCSPTVNSVLVTDVFTSATVSMTIGRKTDRFHLGSSGLKAKPIVNEFVAGSIELGGEFKDNTYVSLYDSGTIFPIVLDWQGSTIASPYNFQVKVTAQRCIIEGEDPSLEGPDVLSQGLTAKVLDDGVNPPFKVEVMSTDSLAW